MAYVLTKYNLKKLSSSLLTLEKNDITDNSICDWSRKYTNQSGNQTKKLTLHDDDDDGYIDKINNTLRQSDMFIGGIIDTLGIKGPEEFMQVIKQHWYNINIIDKIINKVVVPREIWSLISILDELKENINNNVSDDKTISKIDQFINDMHTTQEQALIINGEDGLVVDGFFN